MGQFQLTNDEKICKMITDSKEKGFPQETTNEGKIFKASTSSRQWSGFRNQRIVRVSSAFGGKDRHSKVCTIRGLRDRRIRLSIPTAIQLYDLQDRLGVSQPSKVIDWLLEITKLDIDKLPPLQIPQGFSQFHQQMLFPHDHATAKSQSSIFYPFPDPAGSSKYSMNDLEDQMMTELKTKEILQRGIDAEIKGKWIKTNIDQEDDHDQNQDQDQNIGDYGEPFQVQKLLPNHSSSIPSLLNNAMAYNFYHPEPSCLSLSSQPNYGIYQSQIDGNANNNSQPSGSQLFFRPPSSTPAVFTPYPSYITTQLESTEPRLAFNNMQLFGVNPGHALLNNSLMPAQIHSFSSPWKSFHANVDLNFLDSHNNENQSGKDDDRTGL